MSENHTRAGQNGATSNRLTPSFRTLPRTPQGEKRTGIASATSVPWRPTRAGLDAWEKTTVDSGSSLETRTNPLPLGRTSRISTSPPRGEVSIPRASTPASTGRLLPDSGPRGHTSLWETTVSPWITGGSGAPVCTEGATSDPPDGSNMRPLTYCLLVLGHGDRWVLGESSSEPYRPLAFPDNLCAVRNAGPATDLSQSGHP